MPDACFYLYRQAEDFFAMFLTVDSVEIETEGCVRIDFIDADSVGFPLKHKLYLHNNSELELSESL